MGLFGSGNDLIAKLGLDTSGFEGALTGVSGKLDGLKGTLAKAGLVAAAAWGGKEAIGAALDYESAITAIQNRSDGLLGSNDAVRSSIESVASAQGRGLFSHEAVANAYARIADEGHGLAGTQALVAAAMGLATASGDDLADSTGTLEDVLSAWGLTAKDAQGVSRNLGNAWQATGTDIGDLSQMMIDAGPVARALGMDFGEVAAIQGVLKDKGVDAGSALFRAWKEASEGGTKAGKVFAEFGVSLKNADGTLRPIPAVMADFKAKTDAAGLSSEQVGAKLNEAFGAKTGAAMLALAMNTGDISTAIAKVKSNADPAADAVTRLADSPAGKVDKAKNDFHNLQVELGTALLPAALAVGQVLLGVLNVFNSLSPGVKTAVAAFLAFTGVAMAAGPVIAGVGAAIELLSGPIGWIVLALSLLVAAWTTDFGGIREKTAAVVSYVTGAFNALRGAFSTLVDGAHRMGSDIASAWNDMRSRTGSAMDAIKSAVSQGASFINATWGAGVRSMLAVGQAVFETIRAVVSAVFLTIVGLVTGDSNLIASVWRGLGNTLTSVWSNAWNTIRSNVEGAASAIMGVVSSLWQRIQSAFTSGISAVLGFMRALPGQLVAALGDVGNLLYGAGQQIIAGLGNGIRSAAAGAADAARSAMANAIQSAKNALGIASPSKVFHEIGENVVKGFHNGLGGLGSVMRDGRLSVTMPDMAPTAGIPTTRARATAGVSVTFAAGSIVVNGADRGAATAVADAIASRLRALGVR